VEKVEDTGLWRVTKEGKGALGESGEKKNRKNGKAALAYFKKRKKGNGTGYGGENSM